MKMSLLYLLLPFAFTNCGESFMKSSVKNEVQGSFELAATADAAGNFTSAIDPNSTSTQVLRASSGDLFGSAIALPPGSLSINLNITIGSGETLASSDVTQQLGLSNNAASAAGPAVSFVPSQNVQASNPFTLSIPTSVTGLALATSDSENLVVMYKWMIVENGVTSYAIGIIPRDALTVGSKTVQFQTTKFGTFQLAITQTKITTAVSKPTAEPPILKADVSNPLVGIWTQCQVNLDNNSIILNSPTPTPTPTPLPLTTNCPVPTVSFGFYMMATFPSISPSPSSPPYQYKVIINGVQQGSETVMFSSNSRFLNTSANVNDIVYLEVTPNCHFGTDVNVQRFYFTNSCYENSLMATCDNAEYEARVAAATPLPSPTYTGSATNSGGKDHLGVSKSATTYGKESVKFSTSTFIHTRSIFNEANCTGTLISRLEETGSYKIGAANTDGTTPISISFATNSGTIFSPAGVIVANTYPEASGCGYADWISGQPKNLMSSFCNKDSNGGNKTGPALFKIQGNNLYFDDHDTGAIDTKDFMTRTQ